MRVVTVLGGSVRVVTVLGGSVRVVAGVRPRERRHVERQSVYGRMLRLHLSVAVIFAITAGK